MNILTIYFWLTNQASCAFFQKKLDSYAKWLDETAIKQPRIACIMFLFNDFEMDKPLEVIQGRNVRSNVECSACPAIHTV